ncbi:hypothetical protein HG530_013089 [Fusarium avenaceum]|nr:hypothetical protein HG530_013089 [Fusarium avenaceum]
MSSLQNTAAWLPAVGKKLELGPSEIPVPGGNELLIEVKAVAVQPAEYKIQDGVLPFPLTYPTILGLCFSGIVAKVGSAVTRFKVGDRVLTNSAGSLRNDLRFGAYQIYSLTTQELTAKIGDLPFEKASSVSSIYGGASALFNHLGLEKPSLDGVSSKKDEKVLIWGASSSFGAKSSNAEQDLIALGPFKAVLAAADAAPDQEVIGAVLAAQGGGSFLATMGLRQGATLPPGVEAKFESILDVFLDPKNKEFTEWLWWDYLENALQSGKFKIMPVRVIGGLSKVQEAWDNLREGKTSGHRQVIVPELA